MPAPSRIERRGCRCWVNPDPLVPLGFQFSSRHLLIWEVHGDGRRGRKGQLAVKHGDWQLILEDRHGGCLPTGRHYSQTGYLWHAGKAFPGLVWLPGHRCARRR